MQNDTKKPTEPPAADDPRYAWEPPGGLVRPRYIRGTYETNRLRDERRRRGAR